MDLGLAGAAVVVAGGTTGMGRAAADCFAADGARVAVLARSRADLDATAAALADLGSPDAIGVADRPLRRRLRRRGHRRDRRAVGPPQRRRQRRRADGRRPQELRDLHRRGLARRLRRPDPQRRAHRPGRAAVPAPGRVGPDRQRLRHVDQAPVAAPDRLHRRQVGPHQPHQEPGPDPRPRRDPREHRQPRDLRLRVVQGRAWPRCPASTRTTCTT